VLPDPNNSTRIQGYYTLCSYSVRIENLPVEVQKKLPRYPDIPAALVGWLAVDIAYRGGRLGEHLLLDAMQKVLTHSAALGTVMLIVDAMDEGLAAYYREFGFIPFPTDPLRLFIPVATIAQILKPKPT
jgi:predicted N-acetyltransferase YhbS